MPWLSTFEPQLLEKVLCLTVITGWSMLSIVDRKIPNNNSMQLYYERKTK